MAFGVAILRRMSNGPVYLRVEILGSKRNVADLVEVLPNGVVGRSIGIGPDGNPTYVTRPAQYPYGPWEAEPPTPPGTAAFEEQWREAMPISAEEFETTYALADATLPWTWGGTPTWISAVVVLLVLAIGAILTVGVLVWLAGVVFH